MNSPTVKPPNPKKQTAHVEALAPPEDVFEGLEAPLKEAFNGHLEDPLKRSLNRSLRGTRAIPAALHSGKF